MNISTAISWANEIKNIGGYYSGEGSGYECFVDDGIVCEEKWNTVPEDRRILVLLREAREQTNPKRRIADGIFSLTKFLTERSNNNFSWQGSSTYGSVRQWISAVFDYYGFKPRENVENIFEYVAVANLKKTPGKNIHDPKTIKKFCDYFKCRLREQILEINPYIIILSYEHDNFLNVMGDCLVEKTHIDAKRDNINPLDLYVCELTDGATFRHDLLVFDAYHPCSWRKKTKGTDFETVFAKLKPKY